MKTADFRSDGRWCIPCLAEEVLKISILVVGGLVRGGVRLTEIGDIVNKA